jgi:hypothetical protein
MDQKESILSGRRFQLDKSVMSVRMKKWAEIIQEAATSGLTKTEFCARKGIDRRQFFHWQKQIREYVLENNPELGLPAPPHGQMHQIREVNSQIMPALPVFCEITPRDDAHPAPAVQRPESSFSPGAMIEVGSYRIYVGDSATERILSTILSVIRNA